MIKEFFGPDILVKLAIFQAVKQGATKIAIDGPRLVKETKAVLHKGGIIIGVVADENSAEDAKIRRQRIIDRAEADPTRAADVEKFDLREEIEADGINEILGMANVKIINRGSLRSFQSDISQVLDKLGV